MDHKAIVVSKDVGGRIGLKLNSNISHGGVQLEVWTCATVLAQDVSRQVVPVIEGQQIILTNVETRRDIKESGFPNYKK